MTMFRSVIAVAVLLAPLPAAAASFTVDLRGGPQLNATSIAFSAAPTFVTPLTLTATGVTFTGNPATLTSLSDVTQGATVRRDVNGVSIVGGSVDDQIDTNLPARREGLLISGSRKFGFTSLTLNRVDNNDTFQLYAIRSDNSFLNLGFDGAIRNGITGVTNIVCGTGANVTCSFDVTPTGLYNRYLLTTRVTGGGQGYRVESFAGGVPEPATWGLMIGGFGLAGASLRRQRKVVAA